MIEAWFDGCCEPVNPGGTASYGAVIFKNGARVWEASRLFEPTGETSNNVAEYAGFLAILEELLARGWQRESVIVRGDSKLVIEQMFGTWKMRGGRYIPVALRAKALLGRFPKMIGRWIPREENGLADELSKRELLRAGIEFRIQPEV